MEKQRTEEKITASDTSILALANAALTVVRYAVGSLPPESNRGWPFEELRKVATLLPLMPDAGQDHTELARTFEVFALECERYELRRRAVGINPETLMPIEPR